MSKFPNFTIDNKWVESRRGKKNKVRPDQPNYWFTEKEFIEPGRIEDVSVILLTNKECPFRCLMCDLWKNTTDKPVDEGDIPAQIRYALSRLPSAKHLKLYNSGNFFDPRAIPPGDFNKIAAIVEQFETVTVECHPFFIGRNTIIFRDLLKPSLQVAIGLETVHPDILLLLNKYMTLSDFKKAVNFLSTHRISTRAFILLKPPFLSESESVDWAKKSIDFAFNAGVRSCSVIPVRSGNGAMEAMEGLNYFSQPDIRSLEKVIQYGIELKSGPVFADLWDIERFSSCSRCFAKRKERLTVMNLTQTIYPEINCSCAE